MARKTSVTPTKIYTYGIPTNYLNKESKEIINNQLVLANRYRNKLVEIEINRRNSFRKVRDGLSESLAGLEKEYERAVNKYLEKRKELSGIEKKERSEVLITELKSLKKEYERIWDLVKAERKSVTEKFFQPADEEFKKRFDNKKTSYSNPGPHTIRKIKSSIISEMLNENWPSEWAEKIKIEQEANDAWRKARSESGCFVGTYLAVDDAAKRSFKDSKFNPRFKRFDYNGKVGIQIKNKGLNVSGALSCKDPALKIDVLDIKLKGGKKKDLVKAARVTLRLAGKTKDAVFVDVPVVMHRPLPEDANIKWVYIKTHRVGFKVKYELQFTIESETFVKKRSGVSGSVAVNFGWRVLENGNIRVATIFDGKKETYINLPANMKQKDIKSDFLLSRSDECFNGVKKQLFTWLKENETDDKIKKESEVSNLVHWRSHNKLAKLSFLMMKKYVDSALASELWQKWKAERFGAKDDLFFEGDVIISFTQFTEWVIANVSNQTISDTRVCMALYLDWWRKKDRHLVHWARALEDRMKKRRKEIYRCIAADLSVKYESVIVEDWNKSKTAKKPEVENDKRTKQEENSSSIRQFCGISVFADALEQAFGKNNYFTKKPNNINKNHFGCGGKPDSLKENIMVQCSKCKKLYDQDVNAVKNLYNTAA